MIVEIILSILLLVLSYTSWVQLRKVERCEELVEGYEVWIDEFIKRIDIMDKQLKQIDSRGTFFKSLKDLQTRVTTFIEETTDGGQTNNEEETKKEKK